MHSVEWGKRSIISSLVEPVAGRAGSRSSPVERAESQGNCRDTLDVGGHNPAAGARDISEVGTASPDGAFGVLSGRLAAAGELNANRPSDQGGEKPDPIRVIGRRPFALTCFVRACLQFGRTSCCSHSVPRAGWSLTISEIFLLAKPPARAKQNGYACERATVL